MRRLVQICAIPAVGLSCSASGDGSGASPRKPPSSLTQPHDDPSPSPSNVSQPRGGHSGQASAGKGGQGGSAGQISMPPTGGTAPIAGAAGATPSGGAPSGAAGAAGSGSSVAHAGAFGSSAGGAFAGGSGGSNSPAQGGAGATTGGGQESVGSQTGCPSDTRAKLANGACVDRFREFSVGTNPMSIAVDTQGTIWLTDDGTNELINMDASGNVLKRLDLPKGPVQRELLAGAANDDTFLWLSDSIDNSITQFRRSGQTKVTHIGEEITGLTLGPNDRVWAADLDAAVHELTRSGDLVMTWPARPSSTITVDLDGNPWWPEAGQAALVRMTPAGDKQAFETSDGYPNGICLGPDGAIWFVDNFNHQIGRRPPSGPGRTFDLAPGSSPERIVRGKDQALWFTERSVNKIGRISVNGTNPITHYPIPTQASESYGIAVAPDGTLWFAENNRGKIGRLIPDAVNP